MSRFRGSEASGVVRLSVKLRRSRLDQQLARGLDPGSSLELTLRARQLRSPSIRRHAAQALRRAVHEAQVHHRGRSSAAVPVCREAVIQWCEGLLGVADAIEYADRAGACGVARALELLTDGCGPLYNPACSHLLGTAIWSIADGLQSQIA